MGIPSIELNRRLYTASSVRELDRIAIQEGNIPGIELMRRAGQAVFNTLVKQWPNARQVLVICGAGNNAGDGYVIARLAHEHKLNVTVVSLVSPDKLKNDALIAANEYLELGLQTTDSINGIDINSMDIIVDAILGTGLDRDVAGDYLQAINHINESNVPVISVDIPSGLNADTGNAMGSAVKADCTVTFIGQKQGLYTGEAAEYCGARIFKGLDVPSDVYEGVQANAELVDLELYEYLLQPRARTGHKGQFGHVLVTGGDYGFAGAVRMCGEAAARTGAGLISIATRPEHAYALPLGCPELMASAVNSSEEFMPLLHRASVIAIGPGLGQSQWSVILLNKLLECNLPLVVDADALNLLATEPVSRHDWILTPHPGEAARLLGTTVSEVQSDRVATAKSLQQHYGGVIILKGPGTIIVSSDSVRICKDGNPGMASGGMGDVLTGIVSGLVAQGLSLQMAATVGVCLHARAGDLSANLEGERGMMATDLLPFIHRLVNPHQ